MVTRKALAAYIAASFISTLIFLADYANTYRAFYPAMVALANSSAFRLMVVNAVVAATLMVWFVMQFIFFGKLNASEETALLTSFTIYLAECIIVPLYFNLTLMSTTMVFFAFTLVWRLLHKLAAERVTTLSTVQMTLLPVTRMVAYLNFVLIGDVGLLVWLIQTRPELTSEKSSLHYSLLLIYMLLVTSSLRSAVRFASLFVLRDQHTLLPFVADAITSIAESLLFVSVYAYIFMKSTLPLLLLRGFISHALRIFEKASGLADFLVLARRVRHDMPNATAEDLARDARCTICYEDMVPGSGTKRLPCGHCYHTDCLEHWLEGHSTCPYCRANILRMPQETRTDGAANADAAEANVRPDEGGGAAAAPNAALHPPLQQPQPPFEMDMVDFMQALPTNDPTTARLQHFSAQHAAAAVNAGEDELRAAYQRYLDRVDCPQSRDEGAPPPAAASAATQRPANSSEAPQARGSSGTDSPVRSPTLLSHPTAAAAAASADFLSSATPPPATPRTVEYLKLRAYRKYHRRLREAERELSLALKLAEEVGAAD